MRVLHVISSISPRTGGPANTVGLLRALARRGCEVSLFTTDLDQPARGWLRPPRRVALPPGGQALDAGVRVRYFPVGWPWRFACSWPMARALARELASYDLVHIHSLYLFHGLVAGHLCRRAGVPYVIQLHGTLDPWHRRQRRWRKALYTWLVEGRNLRGAAAIHYASPAEAEHARAAGVTTPGFIVSLGIEREEFERLPEPGRFRQRHPELAEKKLIVFLGRVTPKKGLDLLIPALVRALRSQPAAHLVIAGPDDEGYGTVVEELIRRHGVGRHVTWTGLVTGTAKLELLRDADVWVLPSRDENFGVAVVEAMAAGAAVVISNQVGFHPLLSAAGAGLVVEPEGEALAAALERLLASDALRAELGAQARRLALERLTWDAAAGDLLDAYRLILAGRR